MANNFINNKKKALLARKEKLLEEIQYYEKRITEFHTNRSKDSYFDNESSDSDTDLPIFIDNTPPESELKLQQAALQTSLQAIQELTSLQVLQSEVNVLATEPVLEDEPPVQQPGLWHEVALECRVDLVPFAITFYMHKAEGKFGPRSYRGLRVIPVKTAHEGELAKSVLPLLTTPSDVVEVLKSYAAAHRSRRTSLARLAEKYAESLFMEPMSDGGYMLKCADLLEVSWTLQNKWSPVAPFHHHMKFDLEYMDESYIKIITQLHRQLSDPSLETDERTLLLSKIISTCLEAKSPTQELYESMESDPESAQKLRKRRTTLDQEIDIPAMKKKKDTEVMAPPKSLPKKTKPKGKENNNLKRPSTDEGGAGKKMKLSDISKSQNEKSEIDGQNARKSTKIDKVGEKAKGNKKMMTEVTNTQNLNTLKDKNGSAGDLKNVEAINKQLVENKNPKSSKKTNVAISKDNEEVTSNARASNVDEQKSSKTSKKSNVQNVVATKKVDEKDLQVRSAKSINSNGVENNSKPSKKSKVQNVATTKNIGDEDLQSRESRPTLNNLDEQKQPKVSKKSSVQKNVASTKNNEAVSQGRPSQSTINTVDKLNNQKVVKKSNTQKNVGESKNNDDASQARTSKSTNNDVDELKNPKISKKSNVQKISGTTKNSEEGPTQARVSKSVSNKVVQDKINKKTTSTEANINNPITNTAEKAKKDFNKPKANEIKSADTGKDKNKNVNKNKDSVQGAGSSKVASQNDIKVVEKNKKVAAKSSLTETPDENNVAKVTNKADKVTNNAAKVTNKAETVRSKVDKVINKADKVDNIKNNAAKVTNKTEKVANKPDNITNKVHAANKGDDITNRVGKVTNNNFHKSVKTNQDNNKKAGKFIHNKAKLIATNNIKPKTQLDGIQKVSKIPQKRTSFGSLKKKNPLRISPRKLPLKMKTSLDSAKKTIQKPLTSIPRLLKKQMPKT